MSSPIRLEAVACRLGGRTLVDDVSFEAKTGETLALLGRSGSGKTTALRLINRLLEPTAGRVEVEGRSTLDWDPIGLRRQIGYVIQEVGLFPHFTIEQNVALPLRLAGRPLEERRRRAGELLAQVGLDAESTRHRYPRQLSGGQRQRVGVARALAADPPILLLDEPFGALDPLTRRDLQMEFRRVQAEVGKTAVFVTHDIREALLIGDRIILMEEGRAVWEGAPAAFRETDDPRIAALRETAE